MLTPPPYLSPSAIGTFRQCPQKFKLSRIDKLSEPPTWHTHLGTFVHDVLEHMYQQSPDVRTVEGVRSLAAERWAAGGWQEKVESLEEARKLGPIAKFKTQAFDCMKNLFVLENPADTEFDGMEHHVAASVEGVQLKGIIDRFSFNEDGTITISDYKTGKVPNPRFKPEDDEFFQLLAYALMLQEADQETTSRVEIVYLAEPVVRRLDVTTEKLSIAKGTIVETRESIDNFAAQGDFPCSTGPLCDWCHFKTTKVCPAFKD